MNKVRYINVDDGDDTAYELESAVSVAIAKVGGSSYLFVAGSVDNGVSVFKLMQQ